MVKVFLAVDDVIMIHGTKSNLCDSCSKWDFKELFHEDEEYAWRVGTFGQRNVHTDMDFR